MSLNNRSTRSSPALMTLLANPKLTSPKNMKTHEVSLRREHTGVNGNFEDTSACVELLNRMCNKDKKDRIHPKMGQSEPPRMLKPNRMLIMSPELHRNGIYDGKADHPHNGAAVLQGSPNACSRFIRWHMQCLYEETATRASSIVYNVVELSFSTFASRKNGRDFPKTQRQIFWQQRYGRKGRWEANISNCFHGTIRSAHAK